MSVVWLIAAQDQLQNALQQSEPPSASLPPLPQLQELQEELSAALRKTFTEAQAIVVVERINGYSPGMKNHVLRVEYVDEQGESHAAIVKFADGQKLAKELDGWRDCGRPSNSRGVVLMPLRQGLLCTDGTPRTIVYEDAQQRLRAARPLSLEQMVLTCCRWNDPESQSLEHVLDEIFVELRSHLYQRAHAENDAARLAEELGGRLRAGIAAWEQPHSMQDDCRALVMTTLPGSVVDLLDPLDYLPKLLEKGRHLPEVMRGSAHGDLHSRNILVGLDAQKSAFAAVFDYEDMCSDLLVGWDFAKLETELKVRIYQEIIPGDEPEFIQSVYDFEQRLAAATLASNRRSKWGTAAARETPAERLFALLLALRGQARESLAFQPQRSHSWLHEYYFLLAAYGLYAGKFAQTYGRRQFLSAFVSAAAASAQHAWAKNATSDVIDRSAAQAKLAIQEDRPDERPEIAAAESYHVPFAFAKEFCRSRRPAFVTAGTEILEAMRDRFPYVLDIWQELALAQLELLDLTRDPRHLQAAKKVLLELDTRYPRRSHFETLCRHGRLWKDCGDFSFDKGDVEAALKAYLESLDAYLQAYGQSKGYYPGINAATLYLLVGQPAPSATLAREILADLHAPQEPIADGELTWVLATKGEAHLLLGDCDDAVLYYEQAIARPDCKPHYRSTMHRQTKRILRMLPSASAGLDAERLEGVFGNA